MMGALSDIPAIAGLDYESLAKYLIAFGIDSRYIKRILYWVYRRGIRSFDEINDIPKGVIKILRDKFITGLFAPVSSMKSDDESVKYLFRNNRDLLYETVYLPDGKRHTVCVSVQSGCRMGCRFCATGLYGWRGNLAAGEIVNQVISIPHKTTNVVMMGMGEPGDNGDAVVRACQILTAEWGLAVGKARVTVSTVGVLPFTRRLLEETGCNITLSLHSPFPEERIKVIPAEKRWPFVETLQMIRSFSAPKYRRFTVAYVMIKGVNDTSRHLNELKKLLTGSNIRINLLPYHPMKGDMVESSAEEVIVRFRHCLVSSGIDASIRRSRGHDIAAACGMLAAKTGE